MYNHDEKDPYDQENILTRRQAIINVYKANIKMLNAMRDHMDACESELNILYNDLIQHMNSNDQSHYETLFTNHLHYIDTHLFHRRGIQE